MEMEDFLLRLQESDFGVWVSSAPTIFAYPTILMLHTVGLAMIVGPAWVLDMRLLGYGARLPVEALRGAFRIMWVGFFINASTGIALFVSEADDKGLKWIFWVKLLASRWPSWSPRDCAAPCSAAAWPPTSPRHGHAASPKRLCSCGSPRLLQVV
jgi:hypothetical protein